MFSSIWQKLTAFFALIAGVFYLKSKYQESKIDNLENENLALEKKEQITEYIEEAKESEEIREKKEIKRKAEVVRNATDDTLDNYIDNEL